MKNTISSVFVFFFLHFANGQSVTPSVLNIGGGTFNAGYYQFEWSVGEMALANQMNSIGNFYVFTNGFIQPYILNPSGNNTNLVFGNDEIKVFPNPASDYVEINFFTKQRGKLKINLYDASGKNIWSREIMSYGVDLIERIPLAQFGNATYVLKITLDAKPGYTSKHGAYKIIKIK